MPLFHFRKLQETLQSSFEPPLRSNDKKSQHSQSLIVEKLWLMPRSYQRHAISENQKAIENQNAVENQNKVSLIVNFVAKFEMVEELFVVSDDMVDGASAKYASDCAVAGRRFSPCRHGD